MTDELRKERAGGTAGEPRNAEGRYRRTRGSGLEYSYSVTYTVRGDEVLWTATVRHRNVLKGRPSGVLRAPSSDYLEKSVRAAVEWSVEFLEDVSE